MYAAILNDIFCQSELFFQLQMAVLYGGRRFQGTRLQNVGFLRRRLQGTSLNAAMVH